MTAVDTSSPAFEWAEARRKYRREQGPHLHACLTDGSAPNTRVYRDDNSTSLQFLGWELVCMDNGTWFINDTAD
jgi:hypothetical protein